jgi:hypothetical protein
MGRIKIKKKEAVMPFRETLAYRMLLLTAGILFFLFTLYEMVASYQHTGAFIIAVIAGVLTSMTIFYNLDRLKTAKIPARTLQRLKRR